MNKKKSKGKLLYDKYKYKEMEITDCFMINSKNKTTGIICGHNETFVIIKVISSNNKKGYYYVSQKRLENFFNKN